MALRICLLFCLSVLLIAVIFATTEDDKGSDVKQVIIRKKRGMRWHQRMYQLRHTRNDSNDDADDDRHHRRRGCMRRGGRRGYRRRRVHGARSHDNGSQYRGHHGMHDGRGNRRGGHDRHHGMHHRGHDDEYDTDPGTNDSNSGRRQEVYPGSNYHGEHNDGYNPLHWIHGTHQVDGQEEISHNGDLDPETGLPNLSIHEQRKVNFLSTAQDHFTVNLHRHIGHPVADIVYSPYGIFQALTMMYLGSRSHTAFQMRRVLHLIGMGRHIHHPVRSQNILLNNPGSATLAVANTLLLRPGINITASFTERLESSFQTHVTRLDLDHPDGPETPINELVSNHTHSLIPAVINPGVINENTVMVLANAMYFKAKWKVPFRRQITTNRMFSRTATEQVSVQLMQTENSFKMNTLSGYGARVLELPYEDDRFSMLVILPDEIGGLSTIEEGLSVEMLSTSLEAVVPARVNVYLPKFRLDTSLSLKEKLQNMGMTKAFDPRDANFVSMTRSNNVHITDFIQRVVVDVDEEGTELASDTINTELESEASLPVSEFRCDHPFLFIIRDSVSKVNLFIGKFSGGV